MKIISKQDRKLIGQKYLIYGQPGIGKTTLAAQSVNPLFIPLEDGLANLEVDSIESPKNFNEFLKLLGEIITSDLEYKSLVIDSLSVLERLIYDHMITSYNEGKKLKEHYIDTIKKWEGGFASYLEGSLDLGWSRVCKALDLIRLKGINIILIGHMSQKDIRTVEGENYERISININKEANKYLFAWSDNVIFLQYEENKRVKARKNVDSQSVRIAITSHFPNVEAKNRLGLESVIEYQTAKELAKILKF